MLGFGASYIRDLMVLTVKHTGPCLPRGRISPTCAISVLRNERNCKNVFMSPKINLAWQIQALVNFKTHNIQGCIIKWDWIPFNSLSAGGCMKNRRKFIFHDNFCYNLVHFLLNCTGMDANNLMSSLAQVMPRCCQAARHYLSQCWPWSMSPYGVTRPQWLKQGLVLNRIQQKVKKKYKFLSSRSQSNSTGYTSFIMDESLQWDVTSWS